MPSSPGAQTRRRTARGERIDSGGASAGPARDPSHARSRHGTSSVPRTVLSAAARRPATVDPVLIRASFSARSIEAIMARSGRCGGFLIFLDERDRRDPVHGEGAVLPASLVVTLEEAADQRNRLHHALAAAALRVDIAEPHRRPLPHGTGEQFERSGG